MEASRKQGYLFGGHYKMEYDILGSVLGSPCFRKLSYKQRDHSLKGSAGVLGFRTRVGCLALCESFLHAPLGGKELGRKRPWSQVPRQGKSEYVSDNLLWLHYIALEAQVPI